ncbi:MAG: cation transporter [Rhodospirillales bacterium]|nr:cation transporter [Rhodospirillales bacterium]
MPADGRDRPHDHHSHAHSHGDEPVTADSERRILRVMWLTGGFMIAQAAGGIFSGSLALLADSGHMMTDTAALALAWLAFRMARRPSDTRRSYGYHRFQVLAAFVNGLALFLVAGWIVIEAARRLFEPVVILAGPMLGIAAIGLLVNVIALVVLRRGDHRNLNMRGAMLHVLGDLLGSVGVIGAALIIMFTGWAPIDPILSVVVAVLVLRSAWDIVRRSGHILIEGVPDEVNIGDLKPALLAAVPAVEDIHHVHAWSLTAERPMLTMHATVRQDSDLEATLGAIKRLLNERFGIVHATIQVEHGACPDSDGAMAGRKSS